MAHFPFTFLSLANREIFIFVSKQTFFINANGVSEESFRGRTCPTPESAAARPSCPGPQSKHSCVEYFPHSSVHLRVIWAQLAPRTWSGKQDDYQSKPAQSERLEYEPLTTEAVDAGTWASSDQLGRPQGLPNSSWLDLVLGAWENKIP